MTEVPRRRGRPKGTGLDDSEMLAAITRLITADPHLKPTTAIRRLGVTNPSIVRRLRDKLKSSASVPEPHSATIVPLRTNSPIPASVAPSTASRGRRKNRSTKSSKPSLLHSSAGQRRNNILPGGDIKSRLSFDPANGIARPERGDSQANETTERAENTTAAGYDAGRQADSGAAEAGPKTDFSPPPHFPTQVPLDIQLEAMRLAAEAAAATMPLYLHCMLHANALNPLTLALGAQANSTQWLASAFSGFKSSLGHGDTEKSR